MNIRLEYLELASRLDNALDLPRAEAIYLPSLSSDESYRDEFGFVMLEDGSCGPFYASLPGELSGLHEVWAKGLANPVSAMSLMQGFDGESLVERALALGAFNAVSQHLFRTALGEQWAEQLSARKGVNVGGIEPQPGEWVGMVGYFCPLIEQLNQRDVNVLVLERQPGRVEPREGLRLTEKATDLAGCRYVLCTAATLINDSLAEILEATADAESFNMIGPSGSGLPDVLFAHGVNSVGGVCFSSRPALLKQLAAAESWKGAGRKYQLTRPTYPGLESLVKNVPGRRRA